MEVRITPYSTLIPLSKPNTKISALNERTRFSSPNISDRVPPSRNTFQQDRTRVDKPQYLQPTKSLRANDNNLLLISKKYTNKPQFSVSTKSHIIQPISSYENTGMANNRKVMLYQQIERDKFTSGGIELINRFNYKV